MRLPRFHIRALMIATAIAGALLGLLDWLRRPGPPYYNHPCLGDIPGKPPPRGIRIIPDPAPIPTDLASPRAVAD